MKYKKNSHRIEVQFIDDKTEEILFKIGDRNHTNVGELLTDFYADSLIMRELKGKKMPKKIMAIIAVEFILNDDE